jgi:hypothetical protein
MASQTIRTPVWGLAGGLQHSCRISWDQNNHKLLKMSKIGGPLGSYRVFKHTSSVLEWQRVPGGAGLQSPQSTLRSSILCKLQPSGRTGWGLSPAPSTDPPCCHVKEDQEAACLTQALLVPCQVVLWVRQEHTAALGTWVGVWKAFVPPSVESPLFPEVKWWREYPRRTSGRNLYFLSRLFMLEHFRSPGHLLGVHGHSFATWFFLPFILGSPFLSCPYLIHRQLCTHSSVHKSIICVYNHCTCISTHM